MPKKSRPKKSNNQLRTLVVGSVLVLAAMVLLLKGGGNNQALGNTDAGDLPAAQLQAALAEHRPTLAFFHSTTCHQCIEMTRIVAQVYPEFGDSITLVDVDVYAEGNAPLLQQMRLQYIPTLVFYDRAGTGQASVGVMEAERLRQTLAALAEGN